MRLKEYEGKSIFKKYRINILKGIIIKKNDTVKPLKGNFVIKAQIPIGSRKKSGAIKIANDSNIKSTIKSMLSSKIKGIIINEVLIENLIDIDKELYVAVMIDGFNKDIICIVSSEGGIDIEEVAKKYPKKIIKFSMYNFNEKEIKKKLKKFRYREKIIPIVSKLYKIMKDFDAELVEINPLAVSKNKLIALDSKIIIDDNSLFRHPEFNKGIKLTKIEKKAFENQLQYVELAGNVAVIGDGAGLVMATLDILRYYGLKPSNFLDVGGGASIKKMEKAIEIVLMKQCKVLFINIFGGITKCDEIAHGIINSKKNLKIIIPIIVRMTGTNEEKAKNILNNNKIQAFDSMEECARKIVRLIK